MENRDSCHPLVPSLCGVLLTVALFSLLLTLTIILYGEFGSVRYTHAAGTILAVISFAAYWEGEFFLRPRTSRSSFFAVSFFLAFSVGFALFVGAVRTADFRYLFHSGADRAASLLLSGAYRVGIAVALALLFRIGWEIAGYVRKMLR